MCKGPVTVFVELTEEKGIEPVSRECLGMAVRIAGACGAKLAAVVIGHAIGDAAEEVGRYGIDTVYSLDHPLLEHYEPELYEAAVLQFYTIARPCGILMGHTLLSIDLAPRIAFALYTGLVTDSTGFEYGAEGLCFIKPVYGGNICTSLHIRGEPFMATIRSKSEEPALPARERHAELVRVPVHLDRTSVAIEVVERVAGETRGADLQNADIVIAGGRGIGGAEGFELLKDLAGLLGGAVGASRPPCDLGWAPPAVQVGQTGGIVSPSVYFAVGISGSMQHIAGMAGAKTVVAVNKAPAATIFNIADYGVVGDFREVIPAFTGAIRDLRKGAPAKRERT
jgi:electron transfer flavoprotein alpha subunit